MLTDLALKNLKPKASRYRKPDGRIPGLDVTVQPSGTMSWTLRYRATRGAERVQERRTLGPVKLDPKAPGPGLSIGDARRAAEALIRAAGEGELPAHDRAARVAPAAPAPSHESGATVQAIWDLYLARKLKPEAKPGTVARFEGIAKRCFLPSWGSRPVALITRRDIITALDAAAERGPAARNSAIVVLSAFFNWALSRDLITASPVAGQQKSDEPSRDRALADAEVATFWKGCTKLGPVMGPMFQLMLLTGQRRDEVAGMRYSELAGRQWTIPGSRTKNGKPHSVYLSDAALAALATCKRIVGSDGKRSDFVFTTSGDAPSSGYSKAKTALDKLAPLPHYTLHDLRRSFATGCAALGIAETIVDKCLNHVPAKLSGVAAIYNRYNYAAEMQGAWQKWGAHVAGLKEKSPG